MYGCRGLQRRANLPLLLSVILCYRYDRKLTGMQIYSKLAINQSICVKFQFKFLNLRLFETTLMFYYL